MSSKLRYISNTQNNLKHNREFQFALRHTLQLYHSNAVFSFIPKNACSTMRYSIAVANEFIDSEKDIHWIHDNSHTFNADLKSLITANYTFVILRCPFARLASTFLDKFVTHSRDAFNYYIFTNRAIELVQFTFRQFVESLSKPSIFKHNIHWRPQIDFLIYKNYDDYFAIENFKHIETDLMQKIAFPIKDARHLTQHSISDLSTVKENELNCDMPVIDLMNLKTEGQTVSYKSLYDKSLFDFVSSLYAADIALYTNKFGASNLMKL